MKRHAAKFMTKEYQSIADQEDGQSTGISTNAFGLSWIEDY